MAVLRIVAAAGPLACSANSRSPATPMPVLVLQGEIDLRTRDEFARAAAKYSNACITAGQDPTTATGAATVGERGHRSSAIIDASRLQFIDASGLGVLVALHATLARAGIGLQIINPPNQLRRISGICKLDDILSLAPIPPASDDPRPNSVPVCNGDTPQVATRVTTGGATRRMWPNGDTA